MVSDWHNVFLTLSCCEKLLGHWYLKDGSNFFLMTPGKENVFDTYIRVKEDPPLYFDEIVKLEIQAKFERGKLRITNKIESAYEALRDIKNLDVEHSEDLLTIKNNKLLTRPTGQSGSGSV